MTEPDLKYALSLAASERPAPDPADDLARARTARTVRTRQRVRIGISSLAMTAVVGVGATVVVTGQDAPAQPSAGSGANPAPPGSDTVNGVRLVAATLDASPYTFDLTPQGWSVQGQNASLVTIAPDGSTTGYRDDFEGKLVIMFESRPPGGREVEVDGRRLWITGDSGYTTISTWTTAGEPEGAVRLQYPNDTGWTEDTMIAFTASVHVGNGANYGGGGQEEYPVPDGAQRPSMRPTTGNAGN
ncbi:hypothetical protein [Nocardioides sp. cx-173]|uniref:hypothetical protein n=1 Tax=Nocardioides sp. cx-173 TaxID=2898796 RepID=UPI001E539D2E|nr:hypothetical protein [Nocardioides sp. cx-173]MCD4527283.1 hypothetical protein [Nocardioides sp. cx-173]UGB40340.1 hypothetical protein LQ940_13200 [Nocardioides sp. cx-173]